MAGPGAPAGLTRRLLAGVYDLLPLVALWMIATAVAFAVAGGGIDGHHPAFRAWLLLVALGYYGISWRRGGQTIGMRAWRIKIESHGPLSFATIALRFAVALVGIAAFGAGLWWSLLDREKRMWHDLAAGTRVVRT